MSDTIALVTAPRIAERWPDEETPELIEALCQQNLQVETVAWYEDADWPSYSLVILRSPWDWYWHLEDFSAWLSAIKSQTTILNPTDVVLWNMDKHYLRQLGSSRVTITPTRYVEIGEKPSFPDSEFVVKPVISGGSMNTARYTVMDIDAATAHVELLHGKGFAVMVQPYLPNVDADGEKALVFFNNSFDHAIRKQAVLKPGDPPDAKRDAHPSPQPYTPTPDELALAMAALDAVPSGKDLLYARVDIATGFDGKPVLMELELTDPVLFLGYSAGATERYSNAIANRLDQS
ncbi:MAG: ATP-grasp domain-containing protein [Candidatus Dormibacteraceae bacterium]